MMLEAPQGFVVAEECRKAAWQSGYRSPFGQQDGWARYGSTTARGDIYRGGAGPDGPWFLALDHPGVIAELGLTTAGIPGPGHARYTFSTLRDLYVLLALVYALARSLLDAPLQTFVAETKDLPRATEAERLVVQRVGQDIVREGLMAY